MATPSEDLAWLNSSAIDEAVALWEAVKLPNLQVTMDGESQVMFGKQEECDISRKKLVEATKGFKKTAAEDVRKGASSILRLYQHEIDTLSKRSKAAELAYANVYALLSDAPDPAMVIKDILQAAAAHKTEYVPETDLKKNSTMIQENEKLKSKLMMYENEILEVKNQEVTIKELRAEMRRLEESEGVSQRDAVEAKAAEIMSSYNDQLADFHTENEMLQSTLAVCQTELESARVARQTAEATLFEQKSQLEENICSLQRQMEFLVEDYDRRAQQMLEEYKRANPPQQKKKDEETEAAEALFRMQSEQARLETEVSARDTEINRLISECQGLSSKLAEEKRTAKEQAADFEAHIHDYQQEVKHMNAKLDAQDDYEQVRKELEILRTYEFKEEITEGTNQSLEQLLLMKNKRLQSSYAEMNVQLARHQEEIDEKTKKVLSLEYELKTKSDLLKELESDVLQLRSVERRSTESNSNRPSMSASSTTVENENSVGKDLFSWDEEGNEEDPVDTIINMTSGDTTANSDAAPETAAASLLSIISSQRDRFRSRNETLEADHQRLEEELLHITGEISTLKSDNLALYEKIKFLQSYQSHNKNPATHDQTLDKYSQQYEEKLNPFQAFNENERTQRYTNLSTPEKAIFGLTRFVASNKTARSFVFFYAILLHLLVLGTLYAYSFSALPMDAGECMADFQKHLLEHNRDGGHELHAAVIPKLGPANVSDLTPGT
eukprot:CFRG5600T1